MLPSACNLNLPRSLNYATCLPYLHHAVACDLHDLAAACVGLAARGAAGVWLISVPVLHICTALPMLVLVMRGMGRGALVLRAEQIGWTSHANPVHADLGMEQLGEGAGARCRGGWLGMQRQQAAV